MQVVGNALVEGAQPQEVGHHPDHRAPLKLTLRKTVRCEHPPLDKRWCQISH